MTISTVVANLDCYVPSVAEGPLRQGEILANVRQVILAPDMLNYAEGVPDPDPVYAEYSLAIVVSQDCDLDWDYTERSKENAKEHKFLSSILFCKVNILPDFEEIAVGAGIVGETKKTLLRQNKNERYHYLRGVTTQMDLAKQGLPPLVLDFKEYFAVPRQEIYYYLNAGQTKRRCRLISPYVEHLSTRFCYYQFRVALPRDHHLADT